jgi:nitrite reductase/ring-hydroxylating ferredoxin subunit
MLCQPEQQALCPHVRMHMLAARLHYHKLACTLPAAFVSLQHGSFVHKRT